MTTLSVRDYWDQKAERMGTALAATMRDVHLRRLEIDLIRERLRPSDVALDVGCGNGAATILFAADVARIDGVDYSANMVEQANRLLAEHPELAPKVRFAPENALELSSIADRSYDVVISERCLINLASWEDQQRAILQARRVLRPGGRFLMIEGTNQGLARLNAMRGRFGLHTIEKHWHNVLFDEEPLMAFLGGHFVVRDVRKMGMYYFIGRVLHPLIAAPDEPQFDSPVNEVAHQVARDLRGMDEVSLNALYVLEKPA